MKSIQKIAYNWTTDIQRDKQVYLLFNHLFIYFWLFAKIDLKECDANICIAYKNYLLDELLLLLGRLYEGKKITLTQLCDKVVATLLGSCMQVSK